MIFVYMSLSNERARRSCDALQAMWRHRRAGRVFWQRDCCTKTGRRLSPFFRTDNPHAELNYTGDQHVLRTSKPKTHLEVSFPCSCPEPGLANDRSSSRKALKTLRKKAKRQKGKKAKRHGICVHLCAFVLHLCCICVFSHLLRVLKRPEEELVRLVRKRSLLFGVFPMFVPSLSW